MYQISLFLLCWKIFNKSLCLRFSQHGITIIIDDGCIDTGGKHGSGEILPFLSGECKNTMAGETGTMSQYIMIRILMRIEK